MNYPQAFTAKGPTGGTPSDGGLAGVFIIFETSTSEAYSIKISVRLRILENANPKRQVINKTWIKDFLTTGRGGYYELESLDTIEEISIDEQRSVKRIADLSHDNQSLIVYIPRDAHLYEVTFLPSDYSLRNQVKIDNFVSMFISTFRFTN